MRIQVTACHVLRGCTWRMGAAVLTAQSSTTLTWMGPADAARHTVTPAPMGKPVKHAAICTCFSMACARPPVLKGILRTWTRGSVSRATLPVQAALGHSMTTVTAAPPCSRGCTRGSAPWSALLELTMSHQPTNARNVIGLVLVVPDQS